MRVAKRIPNNDYGSIGNGGVFETTSVVRVYFSFVFFVFEFWGPKTVVGGLGFAV